MTFLGLNFVKRERKAPGGYKFGTSKLKGTRQELNKYIYFFLINFFVYYLLSADTSFSVSLLEDCANDRSISIFLQISLRALAIVLAATSHLK